MSFCNLGLNFVRDVNNVLRNNATTPNELSHKFNALDDIVRKLFIQIKEPDLQFKIANFKNRLIVLLNKKTTSKEWQGCRFQLAMLSEEINLSVFSYLFPNASTAEMRAKRHPKCVMLERSLLVLKRAVGTFKKFTEKTKNARELERKLMGCLPLQGILGADFDAVPAGLDEVIPGQVSLDIPAGVSEDVCLPCERSEDDEKLGRCGGFVPLESAGFVSIASAGFHARGKVVHAVDPKLAIFQRWWRLYHHTLELLKNPGHLSHEAIVALRLFLIHYLARTGAMTPKEAQAQALTVTPLQGDAFYHRDNFTFGLFTNHLSFLNSIISSRFNIPNESVQCLSDLVGFSKVFHRQRITVQYDALDDDEIIERKLSMALLRRQSNDFRPVYFVFEKTEEFSHDDFKSWSKITSTIIKKFNDPNRPIEVVGIVRSGIYPFVIFFKKWKDYNNVDLRDLIRGFGYTPTLQQTSRLLAEAPEFDLRNISMQLSKLYDRSAIDLRLGNLLISDLSDLLNSTTFQRFKRFATRMAAESPDSPFDIVSSSLVRAIEGLTDYPVDARFAQLKLQTVLKECYARLLNFMEVLMSRVHKSGKEKTLAELSNLKDLIFEDIFFIIEVSADKTQAIKHAEELLMEVLPRAPIKPTATGFVSYGMRCVTVLHDVCKKAKEQLSKEGCALNIFSYEDSYFEIADPLRYGGECVTTVASPDYDKSLFWALQSLAKSEEAEKIDLVVVDPHGNMNRKARSVDGHDVDQIIQVILDNKVAGSPLTVAIDLTIGFVQDSVIPKLITKYQALIQSGEINLVFYRSVQKFDSFGTDKVTGGYLQVYSHNRAFLESFASVMEQERGRVDPINPLCLVHLYKHCLAGLEQWRRKAFSNVAYLYSLIDKRFIASSPLAAKLPFFLYEQKDPVNSALVIYVKEKEEYLKFEQMLADAGFPVINRYSFGYLLTNTTGIGLEPYGRFTLGIEDQAKFKIFADTYNSFLSQVSL